MRISAETLRAHVQYDPITRLFRRIKMLTPTATIGRRPDGYVRFMVTGCSALGHVWAWLYMTGEWPSSGMDHRNGDRADNRWSNIRLASQTINMQNKRHAHRRKHALPLGVSPSGSRGRRFAATIQAFGVTYPLGTFGSAEDAHAAYIAAKRRLHPGNTL